MHAYRTLLIAILSGSAVGQTILVSGGGNALANAIVAAPNNAVLQVAPGTYSQVALTVSKNVTIVAPQGAIVSGDLGIAFNGNWQLTVVGISVAPIFQFPQILGGVLATDGSLHAEGCSATGLSAGNANGATRVYVRGCTFGGTRANRLQNADAVLLDSTFTGYSDAGQVGHDGLGITGALGSLRAERISATGVNGAFAGGVGLRTSTSAALVDSHFVGGTSGPGQNWAVYCAGQLTLSNCTWNGPVSPAPTLRTVPSASWVGSSWTVGGTSAVRFQETPNAIVAVVVSFDLVRWTSPLAAEPLYVGLTPNWFVQALGVTGAGGDLVAAIAIPNAPAVQYLALWSTGVFFAPLPARTTCPLGGLIL